jgi:hypothetical protein
MVRDWFRIANVMIGVKYAKRSESGRYSIAIEEDRDTDKSRQDGFVVLQGMWDIGSHLLQYGVENTVVWMYLMPRN